MPDQGVWGGSQATDAEYYSQPIAERGEWNPPTVDPTVLWGTTIDGRIVRHAQ